ncbi:MAG: hypothetical protein KC503_04040 [Myxococcales bacterium]|nr:hypothetical protein [Myxococcales bacterium]
MSGSRLARVTVLLLLALLGPRDARADDNHHQNYLVGERAVGLGGAFTAIADDASANYYNPAGLAEIGRSSLSVSAGMYGFNIQNIDVNVPGLSDSGKNPNSTFISYPTTAAWIQVVRRGDDHGVGRLQLSLSLLTPQSNVTRRRINLRLATGVGSLTGTSDSLLYSIAEDDTLWVGLGAGYKVTRWLSVGAAIHLAIRSARYQTHLYSLLDIRVGTTIIDQLSRPTTAVASLLHFGLIGQAGVIARPTEHLRFGAMFRTPLLRLSGRVDYNAIVVRQVEGQAQPSVDIVDERGDFIDKQPFRLAFGAAYIKTRRFGLSLDFSVYGGYDSYNVVEVASGALPQKKRPIWQLNAGAELYLARRFPIRLGFFTNLSSLDIEDNCPSITASCYQLLLNPTSDWTDRYGVAGSFGYERGRYTLTLAWAFNFGARKVTVQTAELDSFRALLFLVVGASFRF